MKQPHRLLASALAAATLLAALVGRSRHAPGAHPAPPPRAASPRERALGGGASRALRVRKKHKKRKGPFSDPKSVARKAPVPVLDVPVPDVPGAPVRVTIYLVMKYVEAISLFHTDVLTRYGTGRVAYDVVEAKDTCDAACEKGNAAEPEPGPCLAVSRYFQHFSCKIDTLKCNYPRCLTMVTNDESCKIRDEPFDFRQYHSASIPASTSLPLGPRLDTWESFQKLRTADPPLVIVPASQRKYSFNAIFTKSTHKDRYALAGLIAKHQEKSPLVVYAKMASHWSKSANSPKTPQIETDTVVGVMLDSVFTLAPRGHHPECFRLFEAAEAGTIVVLTKADLAGGAQGCADALGQWSGAPAVVLDRWGDLFPVVEGLMQDPARLDRMQQEHMAWYERYMRGAVAGLEDALLASAPTAATALPVEGGVVQSEMLVPEDPSMPGDSSVVQSEMLVPDAPAMPAN